MSFNSKDFTDFGYEDIPLNSKTPRIKRLFEQVTPHYDLMNDMMSFGLHRFWKHQFVEEMNLESPSIILDVASGTCDIPILIQKKWGKIGTEIHCADLTFDMLKEGRGKCAAEKLHHSLYFYVSDAENLPFPSEIFDVCTIVFGIRNITDKKKALADALRVLKKGGRFYCLEFCKSEKTLFKKMFHAYTHTALPLLGKWFASNKEAYQYLYESIERFYTPEAFCDIMNEVRFEDIEYKKYCPDIVARYTGTKIL